MRLDLKAWLWFLSSYAPLWLMLGLRFEPFALRLGLILLGLFSGLWALFLINRRRGERVSNVRVTVSGDAGSEVAGYLAAYLLPFLTVADPTAVDLAAYVIFIVVAGLVYVRSGMMQINPTVYLLGRRVLRATTPVHDGTKDVFVVTRRNLRVSSSLYAERFSDRVFVDHKRD